MDRPDLTALSPSEVIEARCAAFGRGAFDLIYDSYHATSNFRRQFPDRAEYLQYGAATLARDFRVTAWQVLAEDRDGAEARVLFLLDMTCEGQGMRFAELAWMRREAGAWRCHRSQKLSGDELPANPEALTFADFARLDPATIY